MQGLVVFLHSSNGAWALKIRWNIERREEKEGRKDKRKKERKEERVIYVYQVEWHLFVILTLGR